MKFSDHNSWEQEEKLCIKTQSIDFCGEKRVQYEDNRLGRGD